jgi:hypothetical protein
MSPQVPETSRTDLKSASSHDKRCLLVFVSVHQVMKAEKLLKGQGVKIDLIPMPREISSDCGVAIELPWGSKREVLDLLEEHRLPIFACYAKKHGKFEKEGLEVL